MMIKILSFKMPAIKPRAHRVLFDQNTPFKPKVVQRKDLYERAPKHRNRVDQ